MSKKREMAANLSTELKYALAMSIITTIFIIGLLVGIWLLRGYPGMDVASQMSTGHLDYSMLPVILVFILVFLSFPYFELASIIRKIYLHRGGKVRKDGAKYKS